MIITLVLLFTLGIPLVLFVFGLAGMLLSTNPYSNFDKLSEAALKLGGVWLLVGIAALLILIMLVPAMI